MNSLLQESILVNSVKTLSTCNQVIRKTSNSGALFFSFLFFLIRYQKLWVMFVRLYSYKEMMPTLFISLRSCYQPRNTIMMLWISLIWPWVNIQKILCEWMSCLLSVLSLIFFLDSCIIHFEKRLIWNWSIFKLFFSVVSSWHLIQVWFLLKAF